MEVLIGALIVAVGATAGYLARRALRDLFKRNS